MAATALLALGLVVMLVVRAGVLRRRLFDIVEHCRETLDDLGLEFDYDGPRGVTYKGEVDGVGLRLTILKDGISLWAKQVPKPGGALTGHFRLRYTAYPYRNRAKLGSESFDSNVLDDNHFRSPFLLSMLDERGRLVIRDFLKRSLRGQGWCSAYGHFSETSISMSSRPKSASDWPAVLRDMVKRTVAVTRLAKEASEDVRGRLLRMAQSDPAPRVRRRAAEAVLDHFDDHDNAKALALEMLESKDTAIRLSAALYLGSAGVDTVKTIIADRIEAPRLPLERIRRSVELLLDNVPSRGLARLVGGLLRDDHRVDVRRYLLGKIGRHRLNGCAGDLMSLSRKGGPLVPDIYVALSQLDDRRIEPFLLDRLDSDDVRQLHAARALGVVGTRAAVEPLMKHSEGRLRDRDLRAAARSSIARIQERLGDGSAGRLAIAQSAESAGALSVAEEGQGKLSLKQ
jgi:hypothetical protein